MPSRVFQDSLDGRIPRGSHRDRTVGSTQAPRGCAARDWPSALKSSARKARTESRSITRRSSAKSGCRRGRGARGASRAAGGAGHRHRASGDRRCTAHARRSVRRRVPHDGRLGERALALPPRRAAKRQGRGHDQRACGCRRRWLVAADRARDGAPRPGRDRTGRGDKRHRERPPHVLAVQLRSGHACHRRVVRRP